MLNKELESSLNGAFSRARDKRHEFMTVEHLLLALLENDAAREALLACQADIDALRSELDIFIDQTTPLIPENDETRETQPTLSFQRVLQRAVFHVQSSGRSEVTGANVLVAIFSEQESHAAYLLKKKILAVWISLTLFHMVLPKHQAQVMTLLHLTLSVAVTVLKKQVRKSA